jgi:hypothetical protein
VDIKRLALIHIKFLMNIFEKPSRIKKNFPDKLLKISLNPL